MTAKKERRENPLSDDRENMEDAIDFRKYWRAPWLASELSREQRMKVAEEFLEFAEKSREENARRMSKIMKERNRFLPYAY